MSNVLKPTSVLALCLITYLTSGPSQVSEPPDDPVACEAWGCAAFTTFLDPSIHSYANPDDPLNPVYPTEELQTQMWLEYYLSIIIEFTDEDDGICDCQGAPGPEVCVKELDCIAVAKLTVVFSTLCVQTPVAEAKSTACDAADVIERIRLNHCNPPAPFYLIQIRRRAFAKCNKCADETC